jgi:hypothetical protein
VKAKKRQNKPRAKQRIKRRPNSKVYAHIGTEKIIGLHRQGFSHRNIGKLLGMGPCAVGNRLRRNGIRGGRVSRVTNQQLRDARMDAALEARLGIGNRVICRECGELKAGINANGEHSHLRRHDMTKEEYTRKYPGARMSSFATAADQARRQERKTTVAELMRQFAAKYVTAAQLRRCRRDPYWEGNADFVVCRRCGLKIGFSNLSGHIRRHGYQNFAAYRADFPNAPSIAVGYKERYLRPYAKERYAKKRTREVSATEARPLKPRGKPGRRRGKEEESSWFKIGHQVEQKIPLVLKESRRAIIAARQAVASENPQYGVDVIAEYHKRYRRFNRNENTA